MEEEVRIKIPGPLTPIIDTPEDDLEHNISVTTNENGTSTVHIITDGSDSVTLVASAEPGEGARDTAEVGNYPDHVQLQYQWQKKDSQKGLSDIEGATQGSLEIEAKNLPATNLNETYICQVTAVRNGKRVSVDSGDYRITNFPQAPKIMFNGKEVTNDKTVYNIPTMKKKSGGFNTLSFSVDEVGLLSDNLIYLWMYADASDLDFPVAARVDTNGIFNTLEENSEDPKDRILNTEVA